MICGDLLSGSVEKETHFAISNRKLVGNQSRGKKEGGWRPKNEAEREGGKEGEGRDQGRRR